MFNLPMRASCKKYSPRKSIMECDINSNGCNPGRVVMCGNKKALCVVKLAAKLRPKESQLFLK